MTSETTLYRRDSDLSEEHLERLRAQVPDDPSRLPEGHLACEACGIAVPVSLPPAPERLPLVPGDVVIKPSEQFTRCSSCEVIRERADAYVSARPALAGRIGPDIARERVESVLMGLAILGQPVPDDLALALPRMHPAAHSVRFDNPLVLTRNRCSRRPWSHVTLGQRLELRKAYAACLRDRLALSAAPVAVRCPSGGCLICGVVAVERSAIEVARRGGVEAAARSVWTFFTVPPVALGGSGPDLIEGHACPECTRAIEDGGAVGWPARAQAVVTYLARIGEDKKANRLRREAESDFPPVLPAWRADLKARPSAQPWAHLRRVIDRL